MNHVVLFQSDVL